jgi:hypothetical protein
VETSVALIEISVHLRHKSTLSTIPSCKRKVERSQPTSLENSHLPKDYKQENRDKKLHTPHSRNIRVKRHVPFGYADTICIDEGTALKML